MEFWPFGLRGDIPSSFWDVPEVTVTLLDNAPARSHARDASAAASTSVDWKETPTEHVFKADLPGLRKEDVKVQVDGRMLTISGERPKEEVRDSDIWHRAERRSGTFKRKFRLPKNSDLDHIKACVEHGVLTVVVPKIEPKKPESRKIEVGGHDEKPAAVTPEGTKETKETTETKETKETKETAPEAQG